MKLRTALLSVPFFIGTTAAICNRFEAMQKEPQEKVIRSPFDTNFFRDSWETLKDSPSVSSLLALVSLLGIRYDNRRKLGQQYDKYSTQLEKSFDSNSYDKLKQEITDNADSQKLEDGTVIINPKNVELKNNYNNLKKEIMDGEHETLKDGTIRQYRVMGIWANWQGKRCKVIEDFHVPLKDLSPNGDIVVYTDLEESDIKDNNKYKSLYLNSNSIPYKCIASVTEYTPDGKIYIRDGFGRIKTFYETDQINFSNKIKTTVPGTKKLLPDGTIEVYHKPKLHSGYFEKPAYIEKKTVYKPDGTKYIMETELNGYLIPYQSVDGKRDLPHSNFKIEGENDTWPFPDIKKDKHFMKQLQKIADEYYSETGKEAHFNIKYSCYTRPKKTIFGETYQKHYFSESVTFNGETLITAFYHFGLSNIFNHSLKYEAALFDADHYLDRNKSKNVIE